MCSLRKRWNITRTRARARARSGVHHFDAPREYFRCRQSIDLCVSRSLTRVVIRAASAIDKTTPRIITFVHRHLLLIGRIVLRVLRGERAFLTRAWQLIAPWILTVQIGFLENFAWKKKKNLRNKIYISRIIGSDFHPRFSFPDKDTLASSCRYRFSGDRVIEPKTTGRKTFT